MLLRRCAPSSDATRRAMASAMRGARARRRGSSRKGDSAAPAMTTPARETAVAPAEPRRRRGLENTRGAAPRPRAPGPVVRPPLLQVCDIRNGERGRG
eukprot:8004354-Pyramimonas_sp.AAC.1